MSSKITPLPGHETLLASWSALAQISPGARLIDSAATVAAVFPSWAPLNNAIMLGAYDRVEAAVLASQLRAVYADAGVNVWALWVPSRVHRSGHARRCARCRRARRDTTTLVMRAAVPDGLQLHDGVFRVSIAAATCAADDEAVSATDLGELEQVAGLAAWVMVHDDVAVAGAWTFLYERDCGIYAVGTVPAWRRRGLAGSLMEHFLADAHRRERGPRRCNRREWGSVCMSRLALSRQGATRSGGRSGACRRENKPVGRRPR